MPGTHTEINRFLNKAPTKPGSPSSVNSHDRLISPMRSPIPNRSILNVTNGNFYSCRTSASPFQAGDSHDETTMACSVEQTLEDLFRRTEQGLDESRSGGGQGSTDPTGSARRNGPGPWEDPSPTVPDLVNRHPGLAAIVSFAMGEICADAAILAAYHDQCAIRLSHRVEAVARWRRCAGLGAVQAEVDARRVECDRDSRIWCQAMLVCSTPDVVDGDLAADRGQMA